MTDSRVVYLASRGTAATGPVESLRVLSALAHSLERVPAIPPAYPATVAHLQEDPVKVSSQLGALRTLQRFRDGLFHAPGREVEMRLLWRESLAAGCYARLFATELSLDAPLLTGAGLLHRLGEVLALRALAQAEFSSGQRLTGAVLQEITAAHNDPLAARAMDAWALADAVRTLLAGWRADAVWTDGELAARHLALVQLIAFEHVHAGRSTPGVVESAFDQLQLPIQLLGTLRNSAPAVDSLLLRAAPHMGPLSLVQ